MDRILPYRDVSPMKIFKKFKTFSAVPDTKLDEINDDCLAHIFKMLDIHDLYNIACTSTRFENVLPLVNCKFAFSVSVGAKNLKHFLETVGMQIKTLNVLICGGGDGSRSAAEIIEFFEYVQEYCPNVRSLSIKKWTQLNFSRFTVLLKRLNSLRMDDCEYTEIHELLSKRFMIKPWLAQSGCSMQLALEKSTGFNNLTNLTSLRLHRCKGFSPNSLREFLEHNNHLTELSLIALNEFRLVDEQFFYGLAKHLQHIDRFNIDIHTTSHIQFIATLPKLKSLQLLDYSECNDRIVDRLLRKLSESGTIEELDIYHCNLGLNSYRVISNFQKMHTLKLRKNFWVTDQHLSSLQLMPSLKTVCCFDNVVLTDDGVMSLVRSSPQLTTLDVSWCFQVTNRTIHDVQNLLHNQKNRPKLEILVGGRTKISMSVLNDIPQEDNDRISITFEPDMPITCIIQNSFCLNCTTKPRRT